MAEKVIQWKASSPEDFIYFQPYGDVSLATTDGEDHTKEEDPSTLLFIHQSTWQHRPLKRYGNMCLLDATYKTTRYALPLFFLVVLTNVDYQVVESFVVQNETFQCIKEALQLLKKEIPGWNPKYFMTDFCEQEITAIEDVFPGMYKGLKGF